jgi:Tfp pilus assembly PilM family ATPase/Tfp pilus assembly protein PilN
MMGRSCVGLVLRPKTVELIKAHRGFKASRVVRLVSVPIAGAEDADVVQAIQTALERAGVKATRLGVSVPAQEVLLRSFTMPLLPKGEWQAAVQFEARKYIPFKTQELAWGFHVVERRSAKQMAVTFVGMQTENFTQIQEWLSAAGLRSAFLEAQAVSLARLVVDPLQTPDNQFLGVVEVDLQANVAHLVIAKNQVPYLARDVDLNLQREGFGSAPQSKDGRAEVLLGELRLSFDFFTRENPQAVIRQLVLFGEYNTVGPWASWLAEQLRCPVALGELPKDIGAFPGLGLEHAAAVGLALRALRPHQVTIDLVARRAEEPTPKARLASAFSKARGEELLRGLVKPVVAQVVVALLALGILRWIGSRQVATAARQMAKTIAAFPDVGWGLQEKSEEELESLEQKLEARLALLRQVMRDRIFVTEKLDALAKALPEGVWLESLRYQDRLERGGQSPTSLTLRGACFLPESEDELRVISEFVQRIKQDEGFFRGFTTAQLSEITAMEDRAKRYSYRTFGFNCQTDRKL